MPTYEYVCRHCHHAFEKFQSMSEEPVRVCPECGRDVRRVIGGGTGVIFKGSGFYVNDSKRSNPAGPGKGKPDSKPAESSGAAAPACPSCPASDGCSSASA